jgi:hypothetical protein
VTETDNCFFLQQIPQSVYRRTRDRRDGDTTFLSTTLNPLGILDPELVIALKLHIEAQADVVYGALLPNGTWDETQRTKLIQTIFTELGLS